MLVWENTNSASPLSIRFVGIFCLFILLGTVLWIINRILNYFHSFSNAAKMGSGKNCGIYQSVFPPLSNAYICTYSRNRVWKDKCKQLSSWRKWIEYSRLCFGIIKSYLALVLHLFKSCHHNIYRIYTTSGIKNSINSYEYDIWKLEGVRTNWNCENKHCADICSEYGQPQEFSVHAPSCYKAFYEQLLDSDANECSKVT